MHTPRSTGWRKSIACVWPNRRACICNVSLPSIFYAGRLPAASLSAWWHLEWHSSLVCQRYFFFFPSGGLFFILLVVFLCREKRHISLFLFRVKRPWVGVPLLPECPMASTSSLLTQPEVHRRLSFSVKPPSFSVETIRVPAALMDPGVAGHPSVWEVIIVENKLGWRTCCRTHNDSQPLFQRENSTECVLHNMLTYWQTNRVPGSPSVVLIYFYHEYHSSFAHSTSDKTVCCHIFVCANLHLSFVPRSLSRAQSVSACTTTARTTPNVKVSNIYTAGFPIKPLGVAYLNTFSIF